MTEIDVSFSDTSRPTYWFAWLSLIGEHDRLASSRRFLLGRRLLLLCDRPSLVHLRDFRVAFGFDRVVLCLDLPLLGESRVRIGLPFRPECKSR